MHTLGRKMRVDVSNDAGPICLVDVDRWDFHWQNLWWYEQPIHLDSPRSISIRCGYDTTSRTDTVTWGEDTADEMCISYFYLVQDQAPPPACDGGGNPLFGSCIDTFLAGCFQPDPSGTCTDSDGAIKWSDGSTYVEPSSVGHRAPRLLPPRRDQRLRRPGHGCERLHAVEGQRHHPLRVRRRRRNHHVPRFVDVHRNVRAGRQLQPLPGYRLSTGSVVGLTS